MPRARQMPRTRAVRALRTFVYFLGIVVVSAGAAVVRAAEDDWLIALAVFVAVIAAFIALARLVLNRIDALAVAAYSKDWAGLTVEERSLPFGVVAGADGDLLLPSKIGMVIFAWVLAAGVTALGVGLVLVDDATARAVGGVIALMGGWTALAAFWITGTRIRLTRDGIENRVGPRRFHRWLDVPELKVDRNIVIVKAAGRSRPRVWIRAGVLEASVADCVAMIRRQRGW